MLRRCAFGAESVQENLLGGAEAVLAKETPAKERPGDDMLII